MIARRTLTGLVLGAVLAVWLLGQVGCIRSHVRARLPEIDLPEIEAPEVPELDLPELAGLEEPM